LAKIVKLIGSRNDNGVQFSACWGFSDFFFVADN